MLKKLVISIISWAAVISVIMPIYSVIGVQTKATIVSDEQPLGITGDTQENNRLTTSYIFNDPASIKNNLLMRFFFSIHYKLKTSTPYPAYLLLNAE